jgi:hypothetical protein
MLDLVVDELLSPSESKRNFRTATMLLFYILQQH